MERHRKMLWWWMDMQELKGTAEEQSGPRASEQAARAALNFGFMYRQNPHR
jgi:hypothetical protein